MLDFQTPGLILLSYLVGGIPTGYLTVKRLKGIDIREYGSGNPGTANVYRVAGPLAGAITLLIDALKGYLPVIYANYYYQNQHAVMMLCGTAAIIGHDWTVFLRFRGGKGVATSAGVFAAMMPQSTVCAALIFAGGIWATGHISIGSMAGAAALPCFNLFFGVPLSFTWMSIAAAVLILYKHIPNIKRLVQRNELYLHEKKY